MFNSGNTIAEVARPIIISMVMLCLCGFSEFLQADDEQALKANANLPPVLLGYVDFPPLMWEENGEVKGRATELLERIAEDQGFELQYIQQPISRMFQRVAEGSLHAFIGDSNAKAVRGKILFKRTPINVLELHLWALVGQKVPRIEQLADERLIIVGGFSYGGLLKKLSVQKLSFIPASSHRNLFKMLSANRARFALHYKRPIEEAINKEELQQLTSRLVKRNLVHFNVSKKAPMPHKLLETFHRGLERIRTEKSE